MKTVLTEKTGRFIVLLNDLLRQVKLHYDLHIQHAIDDSYYMQKVEELKLLLEQLNAANARLIVLQNRLEREYKSVFQCWQKDARWLNRYVMKK